MPNDAADSVIATDYPLDLLERLSVNERIVEFYSSAGMDYRHWSGKLNMHLGYYRSRSNPFDREQQLEEMNLQVARRLADGSGDPAMLIDLGCGYGAIARTIARVFPYAVIKGVTNVPSQAVAASELNIAHNLNDRVEILCGDYVDLPFDDNTADAVWAVESACYARGLAKENLVREMARVLRAGGRFAVADCFVKKPDQGFNYLSGNCHEALCRYWAVPELPGLDGFVNSLEKHGFEDVVVEDISWRVAPSLAHAPFSVLSFVVKRLLAGRPLDRHSRNNLKASLLAIVLGLHREKFSYCLISGRAKTTVKS